MKIKIYYVSGREVVLEIKEGYDKFRILAKDMSETYVVFDHILINMTQVEQIEEIK